MDVVLAGVDGVAAGVVEDEPESPDVDVDVDAAVLDDDESVEGVVLDDDFDLPPRLSVL